jgi:hypothetical protein
MKLSKEKRDKLILVSIVGLVALAGLYYFVILEQKKALTQAQSRIAAAKQNLARAESWVRMGNSIHLSLEENRALLRQREEQMAPVDMLKWFHDTLQGSLQNHQVRLEDIMRTPDIGPIGIFPQFPYQTATFTVRFSATYHDFGRFLADFENAFPYMRVQNLEISPSSSLRTQTASLRRNETLHIQVKVVTLIRPAISL